MPTCDHGDAHVRAQAVPPASGAHPQPLGVIIGRALGGGQESSAHLHTSWRHVHHAGSILQSKSCTRDLAGQAL